MSAAAPQDKVMVDGRWLDQQEALRLFRHDTPLLERLDHRQRLALDMLGRVASKGQWLDIGCYCGQFIMALAQQHPGVVASGVDGDPHNVTIARWLFPQAREQFSHHSVYALPQADGQLAGVIFMEVLEHVDRPVDALRQINRVLAPGGLLLLSTPNGVSLANLRHSLVYGYKNALRRRRGQPPQLGRAVFYEESPWNRHVVEYSALHLHTLLSLNGFTLVDHRFVADPGPRGWPQRLIPGLASGQIILMQKTGPPPDYWL